MRDGEGCRVRQSSAGPGARMGACPGARTGARTTDGILSRMARKPDSGAIPGQVAPLGLSRLPIPAEEEKITAS